VSWQAPERQRSALPCCRCHWPRRWTRAELPHRPSIRLPVVSWQAPERQRSAPPCCRYHWLCRWTRAERPHRPSNLSGCQSCPGKHRSVSAAPCRVAGTTGRAAGRERNVLVDHLSGCQSCPGKHRSVSAAPCRAAGTTGRATGRELNVLIDHLIYPAASRVLASTGASAQRPAASQVPLAALLEESVPLYHLPDPHCLPYRSSRGTSSPPPRAATAASSGSNLPPRETAGVARWTSTRGNRSSATFLFSCPSSTTIHIPERQGPEAPHSKTRPHRRRHPPGPRRPPGFGMRCSAAPQPSAGEARRCWPTIVQE